MKKIFTFIFFICICFIPLCGNAKTNINLEWRLRGYDYVMSNKGIYYFTDYDYYDNNKIYLFNKSKELIDTTLVDSEFNFEVSTVYDDFLYNGLLFGNKYPLYYNEEFDFYYNVDYYKRISVYIYDKFISDYGTLLYYDDENDKEFIINLLGNKTELYDLAVSLGITIYDIFEYDGYYIVYGKYEDGVKYIIFDYDFSILYEDYNDNSGVIRIEIYNDKIYKITEGRFLEVLDMKGNLLFEYNLIESFEDLYQDYEFYLMKFEIVDNNLLLLYDHHMPKASNDDYTNSARSNYNDYLFVKYRISNDVEHVISNNGVSSSEKKIDEFDREYVELKIEPKEGYIVEQVIVTDDKGNKIDVKDNKFYMPSSDVKVEVKYKGGEYVPIPDTFLGKSVTLIFIGLILVGLGMYTISYVKREEN